MNKKMPYGYIGFFKQPIQDNNSDKPTMFVVSDEDNQEMDLLLLTPGTFHGAFGYIKRGNPKSIRIFVPSLREEYISDIFNLYFSLAKLYDVKWVFPEATSHCDFYKGEIFTHNYINRFDSNIVLQYIKNENLDNVYDIQVKDGNGTHYFSQHLTEDRLKELYEDININFIHVDASEPTYGGLTYSEALALDKKYYMRLIPQSFGSVEQYYYYIKNISERGY